MSQSLKACPQCYRPAPLNAASCQACGHRYRSQFNQQVQGAAPSQTQAIPASAGQASQSGYGVTPGVPGSAGYGGVSVAGPRDETEWKVSCFWHWLGLYLCVAPMLGLAVHWIWFPESTTLLAIPALILGWPILLLFGLATTFIVLRLRRLYVHYSSGKKWWLTAIVVLALAAVPLFAQWLTEAAAASVIHQSDRDAAEQDAREKQEQQIADEQAQAAEDAQNQQAQQYEEYRLQHQNAMPIAPTAAVVSAPSPTPTPRFIVHSVVQREVRTERPVIILPPIPSRITAAAPALTTPAPPASTNPNPASPASPPRLSSGFGGGISSP